MSYRTIKLLQQAGQSLGQAGLSWGKYFSDKAQAKKEKYLDALGGRNLELMGMIEPYTPAKGNPKEYWANQYKAMKPILSTMQTQIRIDQSKQAMAAREERMQESLDLQKQKLYLREQRQRKKEYMERLDKFEELANSEMMSNKERLKAVNKILYLMREYSDFVEPGTEKKWRNLKKELTKSKTVVPDVDNL